MSQIVQQHNLKSQTVWNAPAGRYDEISRSIADAIEHAVERVSAKPGDRILDLATGTGWGSRILAQRFPGVKVIGADIAEQMLDYARATAARQELEIDYVHADAEKLPFANGEFDAVVSTFGVMFVGNPEAAAAELARVVKPGGRLALATWRPDSDDNNVFDMFGVMKRHMAPPPAGAKPPPSPFEWGKAERVKELLASSFDLSFEVGTNHYRYESGEQAWQLWVNHYGPTKTLAANLDDTGRDALRRDLIAWHESFPSTLGFDQPRDYLVTRGVRK